MRPTRFVFDPKLDRVLHEGKATIIGMLKLIHFIVTVLCHCLAGVQAILLGPLPLV